MAEMAAGPLAARGIETDAVVPVWPLGDPSTLAMTAIFSEAALLLRVCVFATCH
jgi:hypothetical protein